MYSIKSVGHFSVLAMMTGVRSVMVQHILILVWVVSFTLRPHYLKDRAHGFLWMGVWVNSGVGLVVL